MSNVEHWDILIIECPEIDFCFLQLAKNIGNAGFNEIMECCLPVEELVKPHPGSDM